MMRGVMANLGEMVLLGINTNMLARYRGVGCLFLSLEYANFTYHYAIFS